MEVEKRSVLSRRCPVALLCSEESDDRSVRRETKILFFFFFGAFWAFELDRVEIVFLLLAKNGRAGSDIGSESVYLGQPMI